MGSEEEEALPKRAIGIRDSAHPEKRDDEGRLILKAIVAIGSFVYTAVARHILQVALMLPEMDPKHYFPAC